MSDQLAFDYHDPPKGRRRVRDLPAEDQPHYRLQHFGSSALATTELLALVLGTADAPGLAEELMARFVSLHELARARKEQLMQVHGIGEVQAGRLLALLALCRRLQTPPANTRPRVTAPNDAANLLLPRLQFLEQEELHVILLDTRNRVLGIDAIYRGSLNSSVVRVGELFRAAIRANAAAVIVGHNHPSGDPAPSPEDVHVTRQIVQAGKLLDVTVLDHLIIGHTFVSLKEKSLGFD